MATPKGNDRFGRLMIWMCGGTLAVCVLLVIALIGIIAREGLGHFWQDRLARVETKSGKVYLGEVWAREEIPDLEGERASDDLRFRIKIKTGNRGLDKTDEFFWVPEDDIEEITYPEDVVLFERSRWGNYHGFMVELRRGDEVLASGRDETWKAFQELHPLKVEEREKADDFDDGVLADVSWEINRVRLERRKLEIDVPDPAERKAEDDELATELQRFTDQYGELEARLIAMRERLAAETIVMEEDAEGKRKEITVGEVMRVVRPNALSTGDAWGVFLGRMWDFVSDDPREANTEGGVLPAIFGTMVMVIIMSIAVVPLGVLAALYLREYAKQGPVVRAVRIAVNNLAGTPSIVFGVFGLGFFVYIVGGTIDELFYYERLPKETFGTGGILWGALTLALLTVPVVIVATEEGLAAVPRAVRQGSLALGATKWETLRKVVLPATTPAILTGTILAMARAAGEVAPLMIVGMVKLADLPLDHHFPFFHPEGKFMHLGFHIYDLGSQSNNVEAVKPVTFATALLLVTLVCLMNLVAIVVRNRLRRKYASSQV